jgi:hypothetical protein
VTGMIFFLNPGTRCYLNLVMQSWLNKGYYNG